MAPSKELDTVLEMIRKRSAEVRKTTDDDRLSYERIMSVLPLDDDIETERVGVNGVPAEWISAPESQENRVVLYLHGGGYLFGSSRTHRVMLAHMARAAKARVLALDYRLAPEIPFPAPVEDSVSAYRWLLSQGISPQKIVIGGDAAGGGLAVAALVALRSVGEPMAARRGVHLGLGRHGVHRPVHDHQRRGRPVGLQRAIAKDRQGVPERQRPQGPLGVSGPRRPHGASSSAAPGGQHRGAFGRLHVAGIQGQGSRCVGGDGGLGRHAPRMASLRPHPARGPESDRKDRGVRAAAYWVGETEIPLSPFMKGVLFGL